MTIVAHAHPFVVGVDTHARNHALTVLAAITGEVIAAERFPSTPAGMARAVAWAARRTGADLDTLWVIEGVVTYGARLARTVTDAGYQVVEAARMNARANRGIGKSDPLDARRIAAAVLPLDVKELRHPRRDDVERAALRVLVAARDHMTAERAAGKPQGPDPIQAPWTSSTRKIKRTIQVPVLRLAHKTSTGLLVTAAWADHTLRLRANVRGGGLKLLRITRRRPKHTQTLDSAVAIHSVGGWQHHWSRKSS